MRNNIGFFSILPYKKDSMNITMGAISDIIGANYLENNVYNIFC